MLGIVAFLILSAVGYASAGPELPSIACCGTAGVIGAVSLIVFVLFIWKRERGKLDEKSDLQDD